LEDECRFAPKHINERKKRGTKTGNLAPLPSIVENDDDDLHGAPLALDQEPVLYPDESEDTVGPPVAHPPTQDPRFANPDGPPPPPPPHPRHAVQKQVENIIDEASTRAFDEDTPSWSTFDIGRAMTSFRSGTPFWLKTIWIK